jgi:hypothetical protein
MLLFGREPSIDKEEVSYSINKITALPVSTPDTSKIFCLIPKCNNPINNISVTENGILSGINTGEDDIQIIQNAVCNDQITDSKESPSNKDELFIYNSHKSNLLEIIDTTYKYIHTDSITRKIPVYNSRIEEKNIETKAQEAADFIIKLRKRKFRMMTGMDQVMPEGSSAEAIIAELDRIEADLLSLFNGKTLVSNQTYTFQCVPEKNYYIYRLFSFDENSGLSECSKEKPVVYLEISPSNDHISIDTLFNRQKNIKCKGIPYNVPENAEIIIHSSEKTYFQSRISISQLGYVSRIPAKMVNRKNKIIFYPETGAIKFLGEGQF